MSYLTHSNYNRRFVELTLSSDQAVSVDTSVLVDFDTIRGDAGHSVSLVSGGNGRIRFSANCHYWCFGTIAMNRDSDTTDYTTSFFATDGTELTAEQGSFNSALARLTHAESRIFQLLINPTSDTDYDVKVTGETGDIKSDGSHLIIIEMS
tara:strand:+ start:614 stop:1066 length:453 start_codon:yes stop_codon:yes gene_type:complete